MTNVVSVERNGQTYHFVTRGRSKPFSQAEIDEFFGDAKSPPVNEDFRVEGDLRKIFSQDLRSGLDFCTLKYGVSAETIMAEAKRLFPTQNIELIVGKKE